MTSRFPERRGISDRSSRDAGVILAQTLLIRALRRAGQHHILLGRPGMVGFVVRDTDLEIFARAGQKLLDRHLAVTLDEGYEVVKWRGSKPNSSSGSSTEGDLRSIIASNSRVFGFTSDEEDIPPLFRSIADDIVSVGPVDLAALRGCCRNLLRRIPPDRELVAALELPLTLLSLTIKHGRNLGWMLLRLKSLSSTVAEPAPKQTNPHLSLADLHGFGEAAEWGHALAVDLADYRMGKITWVDVDRGIVLSGSPGVGKTIFAQALAITCNVPLHSHSLARWQAKGHLGDLLKAMRRAFDEAKKDAPCILFLDELDSFGDRENADDRNAQYTREVINGFLECLDGIEGREGVVVVGATNWPGKIDPAILRPGRLDRHVRIPLPDAMAREGILRHHLRGALPQVDLSDISERLEGATGADIERVVCDAKRKARSERRPLAIDDLLASLPARVRLSDATYRRACVHEAGHAVVGYLLGSISGSKPLNVRVFREVSDDGSGGRTEFDHTPGVERTEAFYLAQITTLLAGLAAEQAVLGEHGSGGGGASESDLHLATVIAGSMEMSLGLGQGLIYRSGNRAEEIIASVRIDPLLRQRIDARLQASLRRARDILDEHHAALNTIAAALAGRGRVVLDDIVEAIGAGSAAPDRINCPVDANPFVTSNASGA